MEDYRLLQNYTIIISMSSQESGDSDGDNEMGIESIKTIASSYGITKLNDEALQYLLEDVCFRLKEISQVVLVHFYTSFVRNIVACPRD